MELRTFENFPEQAKCSICGNNDNKECFLVPIDGTGDDGICEAKPIHLQCFNDAASRLRYNEVHNLFYFLPK